MSVKALIWLARSLTQHRIYCYHEIVHNGLVVNWFEQRGVRFINSLDDIPRAHDPEVALMLSAHGTDPKIAAAARTRFKTVIDSACPLVTMVHNQLRSAETKHEVVIYLGDPHHDEGAGTLGAATRHVHIVRPSHWAQDIAALGTLQPPMRLLTQTTLSQDLYHEVLAALRSRFGEINTPLRSDLCYATTNRQDVVKEMGKHCDHVLVIGSVQSANTLSLERTARSACSSVWRINSVAELPPGLAGIVGITAGASAPEMLVGDICNAIAPREGTEEFAPINEDQYFRPPPGLRKLAGELGSAAYYDLDKDATLSVHALMQEL